MLELEEKKGHCELQGLNVKDRNSSI